MEISDLSWLAGVSALLATLGGGVAWLVKRHDSKKDPLPREQAEVAVAAANVGLLSEVNVRLGEESRRQATKLDSMEAELLAVNERAVTAEARADEAQRTAEHNQREIADLQESQGSLKALFGSATGFIEELLRWVHDGMPGAAPALPSNLRAFIDHSLHGTPHQPEEHTTP